MGDLPPPSVGGPPAERPALLPTDELLARFQRLVLAMFVAAAVLALLPIPAVVHVVVLLVLPVMMSILAVSSHERHRNGILHRYARRLWDVRRDRTAIVGAADEVTEPVSAGIRRAWLLMGLFVVVFLVGLVLAGLSAGVSERLYG